MQRTDQEYAEYKAKLPSLFEAHEAAFQCMQTARQRKLEPTCTRAAYLAAEAEEHAMWAETDRLWREIVRPGDVFSHVRF